MPSRSAIRTPPRSCCPWSTTSCASWRLRSLPRKRRVRHSKPPTWFMRPASSCVPPEAQHWDGRRHFFAAAAEAMRRILINRARDRHRLKRGGGRHRVDLDALAESATAPDADLLDLDGALDRLAASHPRAAELVKLKFFAGMTLHEAA